MLFMDIDKLILKFIWRVKRSLIANTILKEKNKVGGLMIPDFTTRYKTKLIRTACSVNEETNRSMEQNKAQNRAP